MNRVEQLSNYLKEKFLLHEVTGPEIVVTLMAMVKDGRLEEENIKEILYTVFNYNTEGIVRSIQRANLILDDDLLNSIIEDVNKALT